MKGREREGGRERLKVIQGELSKYIRDGDSSCSKCTE